jgi:hypothetical protein
MTNLSNITSTHDVTPPPDHVFRSPEGDDAYDAEFGEVPIDDIAADDEVSMEDLRREWFVVDNEEEEPPYDELGGSD